MTAHRPFGIALHLTAVLASSASRSAGTIALERGASLRWQRLRAAIGDRVQQRRRPSRPRMRALTASHGGRFTWRDVPVPPLPGPDAAIVHPIAVATCDLDRAMGLGRTPFPLPMHFGHECVAEVLEVGERVRSVRPGDRVVVPFQISCGTCPPCRSGRTASCASVPPISMYGFGIAGGHWGGVLSDQVAVPFADAMLVPLPDGIDPADAASVADNVSDGYRSIAPHVPVLLDRDPDAPVLILSELSHRIPISSSVLLYAGLVGLALGVRRIDFVDRRPHVRRLAESLGLQAHPPKALGHLGLAPLVLDGTITRAGLTTALLHTAPDGTCVTPGSLHRSSPIPTAIMYGRNVTYHLSRSHARTVIPHVLDLMCQGKLRPERVTTELARLDDAPTAIRRHVTGEATKTVLVH